MSRGDFPFHTLKCAFATAGCRAFPGSYALTLCCVRAGISYLQVTILIKAQQRQQPQAKRVNHINHLIPHVERLITFNLLFRLIAEGKCELHGP